MADYSYDSPEAQDWFKNYPVPKGDEEWEKLPLKDRQQLMWDTPTVSSRDPSLQEGSSDELHKNVDDLLNIPQEQHDKEYEELKKSAEEYNKKNPGSFNILGTALPANRLRGRDTIPAIQEYLKKLPDDTDAYKLQDGTVIFRKRGKYDKTPTS